MPSYAFFDGILVKKAPCQKKAPLQKGIFETKFKISVRVLQKKILSYHSYKKICPLKKSRKSKK